MKYPSVSIIIPTYNSEKIIISCLDGIVNQKYPKQKIEILVVDNQSQDNTSRICKSYGSRFFTVSGKPPQVCRQRNLGVKKALGEWLLILDHDMGLNNDLLESFAMQNSETHGQVTAWYIPEVVVSHSKFYSGLKTLEKRFYDGTVINAARLIRKDIFLKTSGYDLNLSGGPADWDMDIQLRMRGVKFGYCQSRLYHHEEGLTFSKVISKKKAYFKGCRYYREKWRENKKIYQSVVSKQFSPYYRYFFIFLENGKWHTLLLPNLHYFIPLLLLKLLTGIVYLKDNISSLLPASLNRNYE